MLSRELCEDLKQWLPQEIKKGDWYYYKDIPTLAGEGFRPANWTKIPSTRELMENILALGDLLRVNMRSDIVVAELFYMDERHYFECATGNDPDTALAELFLKLKEAK